MSLDNETEQQNSKNKEQNELSAENEGTQKEGSKYTPSSQSETAGSGLPDQENLAHEFADPSLLHFTVTDEEKQKIPRRYHLITEHELGNLNKLASELAETAKFYNDELSSGIINYIYVEDQQVKTLRVRFGKENFAHLTGLIFDKRYGLGDEPLSDREWTKHLKAYTQVEKDIRRHSNRIQNIVSGVSSEVDKSVNELRMNERVIAP